jgi:hypothetical protein
MSQPDQPHQEEIMSENTAASTSEAYVPNLPPPTAKAKAKGLRKQDVKIVPSYNVWDDVAGRYVSSHLTRDEAKAAKEVHYVRSTQNDAGVAQPQDA